MLSPSLDYFFKNIISFNSSHYETLSFLPFRHVGESTFLLWCCVVIAVWLLLLVNGKALMLRFALVRYIVYLLGLVLKLFFPCFLLYRMVNYQEMSIVWESYLCYTLIVTVFSAVTFALLEAPFCIAIYKLTLQVYTLMGLSFFVKLLLNFCKPTAVFTSFYIMWQNEGLILLPLVAETLLCITLVVCFHSLFLVFNRNNESIRYFLVGTILLIFCSFFALYSNNISRVLFPISGVYFGFILLLIITKYLESKPIMWSLLFYVLGLIFAFSNFVMPFMTWSSIFAESLVFLARAYYTYTVYSDEGLTCLDISVRQAANFADWQQHLNVELLFFCVVILVLFYSIVSYNMLTKDDINNPSLTQLHINMLFVIYFIYAGSADFLDKYSRALPPATVEALAMSPKIDTTNKHLEYWSNPKNRRDAAIEVGGYFGMSAMLGACIVRLAWAGLFKSFNKVPPTHPPTTDHPDSGGATQKPIEFKQHLPEAAASSSANQVIADYVANIGKKGAGGAIHPQLAVEKVNAANSFFSLFAKSFSVANVHKFFAALTKGKGP